jgi:hypothetical protein
MSYLRDIMEQAFQKMKHLQIRKKSKKSVWGGKNLTPNPNPIKN